ncbi:SGNH/GDSL hydrolase family protein [Bosea sp. BK604]|uniref:SGNH/GDSL hydrolase family protein n=1 Tax=Bosea sp. BK604 TaxID=2512180 RepID=UPI00104E0FE1|nr:SGNH/GDSL hydrolase family protein [Bosea sp. BK604]TCR63376.1 GDSL-like lipase/acylhydrolase family protein [Bosea sp. BK604]
MIQLAQPSRAGRLAKLVAFARACPALAGGIVLCVASVAAILGGAAGLAFGQMSSAPASDSASYRDARVQTIGAHLRQFDSDYLLVAGDSHAEHWFVRSLCGLPVVNAGLSGATAQSYARFFADLPLSRPPRAIILTIGTNDAQKRRIGDPDTALSRFESSAGTLLALLGGQTRHIIVTAVPPLDPARAKGFSPGLARRFSTVLKAACREPGCNFVDPFASGVPLFDGVHLTNYAGAFARFERDLCPLLSAPPSIRTADQTRSRN